MSWVMGQGEDAKIRVSENGRIIWNQAAYVMLGRPDAVGVFYDADGGRLGLAGTITPGGCKVSFDGQYFKIEATQLLENLGLEFEEGWTADLQEPMPPIPPDDLGDEGIYWVNIPE